MITEKKMQAYEDVRQGGQTNMFDVRMVMHLASVSLTKEDCLDIMKHYDEYMEKFNIERR